MPLGHLPTHFRGTLSSLERLFNTAVDKRLKYNSLRLYCPVSRRKKKHILIPERPSRLTASESQNKQQHTYWTFVMWSRFCWLQGRKYLKLKMICHWLPPSSARFFYGLFCSLTSPDFLLGCRKDRSRLQQEQNTWSAVIGSHLPTLYANKQYASASLELSDTTFFVVFNTKSKKELNANICRI